MQVPSHFPSQGGHHSHFHGPHRAADPGELARQVRGFEPHGGGFRHRADSPVPTRRSHEPAAFDPQRAFAKSAKSLVRRALAGLARDVGRVFESVGLDAEAGKALVKGFVKPLVQALRQGLDFTAEFRLAAAQATRVVTGEGVAESLSLYAKSVSISVDHGSGEVAVSVQEISIQQDSLTLFGEGGQAAAQDLGVPTALPDLLALLEQLRPGEAAATEGDAEAEAGTAPETDEIARTFDPPLAVELPAAETAAAQEPVLGYQVARSRLLLRAVERLRSESGDLVTRLTLDAQVSLQRVLGAGLTKPAPQAKEPALDLSA